MTEPVLLSSLSIKGFRGYREKCTLAFDRPVILLSGPNMAGKSSTLGAIEWALFGDFSSVPQPRDERDAELVNDLSSSVEVTLILEVGEKQFELKRSRTKRAAKTNLTLTNGQSVWEGNGAEHYLFRLLGMTAEDFRRGIFMHQETPAGLLRDAPTDRSRALDRLLGLEKYTDLLEMAKTTDVRTSIREFENEIDSTEREIRSRMEEANRNKKEAVGKARMAGLSETDLNLTAAKRLCRELLRGLGSFAKDIGAPEPKMPSLRRAVDIALAVRAAEQNLQRLRKHFPESTKQREISQHIASLTDLMGQLAASETTLRSLSRERNQIEKKNGTSSDIEAEIDLQQRNVKRWEKELDTRDKRQKVVLAALSLLKAEPQVRTCPVCDQKINAQGLRKHLEEDLAAQFKRDAERLEKRKSQTQHKIGELQDVLDKLNRVANRMEKIEEEIGRTLREVAEQLRIPLQRRGARKALREKIRELEKEKTHLERAIAEREDRLDEIQTAIEKIRYIGNVLDHSERITLLEGLYKSKDLDEARKGIRELAHMEQALSTIAVTVQKVQAELAIKLVDSAQPKVNEVYRRLVNHPLYIDLQITVTPEESRGRVRNQYLINAIRNDGTETQAHQRLSHSGINCAALAIFFGISLTRDRPIRFLILDEPTQGLDQPHKEALASMTSEVSTEFQVLVGTADPEFVKLMRRVVGSDRLRTHKFRGWNPETGIQPSARGTR